MKILAFISLVLLLGALPPRDTLVVHEWGTFTCLQDEAGQSIGGINTDDEPVPQFVHDLSKFLLIDPGTELPPAFYQGAPRCHPDVTMRLETPVIYFHLPRSQMKPATVDVNVEFRGGWLTQFYPYADAVAPGVGKSWTEFGPLRNTTVGRLSWGGLVVGGDAKGPVTTEHVWTSPRAIEAASVTTTNNESETFLFYRGVAHVEAPLRIARDDSRDELVLRGAFAPIQRSTTPFVIHHLWLTEIRADGSSAFRRLKPVELSKDEDTILARTPARFAKEDFGEKNTARFREEMHRTLVEEGLFGDEADALLNTWELSYFKSPGLRLFFIVPRSWTDYYLPLEISVSAQVQRVMMGRIELVTPAQRVLLSTIAAGPTPKRLSADDLGPLRDTDYQRLLKGRASLTSVGVAVPPLYRDYLNLGRFRNALILDEQKRRPSDAIREFIKSNGIEAYKPSAGGAL
jgi:hypothetical protein